MVLAAVLIVAGVNLLAFGLLAEMQVRHYHEPSRRAAYAVDKLLRTEDNERVPE
jgi:hypothetical protein